MVGSPASAKEAPHGGLNDTVHLDGLLQELRRGERDAFVGYFQLFRARVYGFALHLLGDETAAVAATTEAFVAAFREIILDKDATDLQVVTFRRALDACIDRAGGLAAGAPADGARRGETPPAHGGRPGDIVVLTGAALESLDMRRRAALLLHDVHGLDIVQTAAVFSVTAEAAGAQLFRARETFQQALAARSTDLPGGRCRQAEQAAAGAVGQGLGDDELRRLRRHTAYCGTCRTAMKGWGGAPIGLAVLIMPPAVPRALAMAPVFGVGAPAGEAPVAAGTGPLGRILRPVGRVLRSRSAAYVVALACIALAIGVASRQEGVRRFVLAESVGPAIRLVIAPPADARKPAKDRDTGGASVRPSSSGSQQAAAGPAAVSQPLDVVSQPAVLAPSGDDASVGTREGDSDTAAESAPGDASAAGASSAVAEGGTAKAERPDAKGRQEGKTHDGHHARAKGGKHDAHIGDGHRPSGGASGAHASHGSSHHVRSHASHGSSHHVRSHASHGSSHHVRSHASHGSSHHVRSHASGHSPHKSHKHPKKDH
jgi:DNA-directed RNA polymerase specialized sigma24 family protein